jgi:hypothetical protein
VTPDFDELIGGELDLEPEERERLLRTHELLVAAGPPPELPPSLETPAVPEEAEVVPFFNRRRHAAVAVLAAALAVALFGGGFLVGHRGGGTAFAAERVLPMRATPSAPAGAVAALSIGREDSSGNWPMLIRVTNLKKLPPRGYYALWLTRNGRAVAPCGTFVATGTETAVHLNAPYDLKRFDGWVVTEQQPGEHEPGTVILTTV